MDQIRIRIIFLLLLALFSVKLKELVEYQYVGLFQTSEGKSKRVALFYGERKNQSAFKQCEEYKNLLIEKNSIDSFYCKK